jgi:LPPG:FO 2-phospho-L-lactate transferase
MSRTTLLAGGVGGARLARGLAGVIPPADLTIVGNVGDDERIYGAHVSADLDTVMYTLAGVQGRQGWGIEGDSYQVIDALASLGVDTSFRLGDRDLAACLRRTHLLDNGVPLSEVTRELRTALGVEQSILPATDDLLRTRLKTEAGWLAFQDYFVLRRHRDEVLAVEYRGAEEATPAPGVLAAIESAATVVIAPSNPPLSIHPILAVGAIRRAVAAATRVIAVSPLFGGKALKGPADRVMASLGYPQGTAGVLEAYEGLLTDLVIDTADEADARTLRSPVTIHHANTRFPQRAEAVRFAQWLMDLS